MLCFNDLRRLLTGLFLSSCAQIHTFSATVDVEVHDSTRNDSLMHCTHLNTHTHTRLSFAFSLVRCSQYKCAFAPALQRAANVRMPPPMHHSLTVLCSFLSQKLPRQVNRRQLLLPKAPDADAAARGEGVRRSMDPITDRSGASCVHCMSS